MNRLYRYATALALLLAPATFAQQPVETPFSGWLESVPLPKESIDETAARYGNGTEQESDAAYRIIYESITRLREGFYERFRQDLSRPAAALSAEERQLLDSYRRGSKDLGEEARLSLFGHLFQNRPLLAAQTFSWEHPGPWSAAAAAQYRALLDIERALNWPAFHAGMEKEGPLPSLARRDEATEALTASFARQLAAVPKKKVKLMAGSDETVEMEDPEAIIRLLKEQQRQLSALQQKAYGPRYAWFRERFERVQAAALRLDSLLQGSGYGASLEGADESLRPLLAGLQLRVWEMMQQLHSIAVDLVQRARIKAAGEAQTGEAIKIYEKMARGEGMP